MSDRELRQAAKRLGIPKDASIGAVVNAILDRMDAEPKPAASPLKRGRKSADEDPEA